MTIEKFATRVEALAAEKIAIQTENPVYNIKSNPNVKAKSYLSLSSLKEALACQYISRWHYDFYIDIRRKYSIHRLTDKQESMKTIIETQIVNQVRDKSYIKEDEYWDKIDAKYKKELGVETCQNN